MIRALIEKDLKLYFRNPFFALITGLGLVAMIALYFLLPAKADDSLSTALVLPADTSPEMSAFLSDAFESDLLDSQDALMKAVEAGDYSAGMVLTDAVIDDLANGRPVDVPVYTAPGMPPELKQALTSLYTAGLNNVNYVSAEEQLHINDRVIVLGPDLLDINEALALRDRMLPMLIMMMFAIELMGLANLISEEVTRGTVKALLVTPLRVRQFFGAKMLMGVGLAFCGSADSGRSDRQIVRLAGHCDQRAVDRQPADDRCGFLHRRILPPISCRSWPGACCSCCC